MPAPLAHADDEELDLEIGWRLPPAKHLESFWAFSYSIGEPRGRSNHLMMYLVYSPFPSQIVDSHLHLIRGGLNYNLELRWDGVPSLADGLRILRQQARRTPPGQWVRVVGGWSEFQFAERRMPTPRRRLKASSFRYN